MTSPQPKLSVCVITYNHARYIRQALDGILKQEVDFDYEVIVSDDASTDGTPEIIREYASRLPPERFRPILRERNNIEENFFGLMRAPRGKYIAYLEADDFWTSPKKLKAQVDFLEQSPDYAIAFHNAQHVAEDGETVLFNHCAPTQKQTSTLEDLFDGNFIPSASMVFRRGLFGEFPAWRRGIRAGDWVLHMLNAQYGKIRYFDEIWSRYRHHSAGIWSSTPWVKGVEEIVRTLEVLRENFNPEYRPAIQRRLAVRHFDLATHYAREGEAERSLRHLQRALRLSVHGGDAVYRKVVTTTLRTPPRLVAGMVRKHLRQAAGTAP